MDGMSSAGNSIPIRDSSPSLDSNPEIDRLKAKVSDQAASVFGKSYIAKTAVKFIASPITGGLSYIARSVNYLWARAANKYATTTIISGPAGVDAAKIELTGDQLRKIEEAENKLETLRSQASGDIAKFLDTAVCAEDYSRTEKALQMLVKQIASSTDSNEVEKLKKAFNESFKNAIKGFNSWTNQKIISLFLEFPMLVSDWNKLCEVGSTVDEKFKRPKLIKDSFIKNLKVQISHTNESKINPELKEMLKFPELIPEDYWSSVSPSQKTIEEHVKEIISEANTNKGADLISKLIGHIPSSVIPWGTIYDKDITNDNKPAVKEALEKRITEDFLRDVTKEDTGIKMQGHPEMVNWVEVIKTVGSRTDLDPLKKERIRENVLRILDEQIKQVNDEPKAILTAAKLEIDILSTKDASSIDIKEYIYPSEVPVVLWEKLFEVADKDKEVEKKLSDEFHAVIRESAKTGSKIISQGWSLAKRIDWKQILSESKGATPEPDSLSPEEKTALVNRTIIDSLVLIGEKEEFVDEETVKKLLEFPQYIDVGCISQKLETPKAKKFFVNEGIQSILKSGLSDSEKEAKIQEFLTNDKFLQHVDWKTLATDCQEGDLKESLKNTFKEIVGKLTSPTNNKSVELESCIKSPWFKDIVDYKTVFGSKDSKTVEVLKGPFYQALLDDPEIINESNWSYVDWKKAFKEIDLTRKADLNEKFNQCLVSSLRQIDSKDVSVENLSGLIKDNKDEVNWKNFNECFEILGGSEFKERLRQSLIEIFRSDMEDKIRSISTKEDFQEWISDKSEFIDWKAACDVVSTCVKTKQKMLMPVLSKKFNIWLRGYIRNLGHSEENESKYEYLKKVLIENYKTPDFVNFKKALDTAGQKNSTIQNLIKEGFLKILTREISHSGTTGRNLQIEEMMKFPELIPQDYWSNWSSPSPLEEKILTDIPRYIRNIFEEANKTANIELISKLIEHIPSFVISSGTEPLRSWGTIYDKDIKAENKPAVKKALEKRITEDFLRGVTKPDFEMKINDAIQNHPEMVNWGEVAQTIEPSEDLDLEKKGYIIKVVFRFLDQEIQKSGTEEAKAILLAAKLEMDIVLTQNKNTINIDYIIREKYSPLLWEKLFEVADKYSGDEYQSFKEKLSNEFHAVIRKSAKQKPGIISNRRSLAKRIDWNKILSDSEPYSLSREEKTALVNQTIIDSLVLIGEKEEFVDQETARKLLQFPQYINVGLISEKLEIDEAKRFFVNEGIQGILQSDLGEKEQKIQEFLSDKTLVSYVDWTIAFQNIKDDKKNNLKGGFNKYLFSLLVQINSEGVSEGVSEGDLIDKLFNLITDNKDQVDWKNFSQAFERLQSSDFKQQLRTKLKEIFDTKISDAKEEEINPELKEMLKFPELVPEDYWSSVSSSQRTTIKNHVINIIIESDTNQDVNLISKLIGHIPSSVISWGTIYDNDIKAENKPAVKKALEKRITKDFLRSVNQEDSSIMIDDAIQNHPEMVNWVEVVQSRESKHKDRILQVLDQQIEKEKTKEPKAILLAAKLEIDIVSIEDKSTIDIKKYINPMEAPVVFWEKLFEVADKYSGDEYQSFKEKLSNEFHAVIRKSAKTEPGIISNVSPSLAKRIVWEQILSEPKEVEPSTASAAGADSLSPEAKTQLVNQTIIASLELENGKFVDEGTARKLLEFPQYINVDVISKELGPGEPKIFFVKQVIKSILESDLNEGEKEQKIQEFLSDETLVSYVDWTRAFQNITLDKKNDLKNVFNKYLVSSLAQSNLTDSLVDKLSTLIRSNKEQVDWEKFNQAFGNLEGSKFKEDLRQSLIGIFPSDMESKITSTITEQDFQKWISDRSEFIDWKVAFEVVSRFDKTNQETLMSALTKSFNKWLQGYIRNLRYSGENESKYQYLEKVLNETPNFVDFEEALNTAGNNESLKGVIRKCQGDSEPT